MATDDAWSDRLSALGDYIRTQRRLANLSLRDMAERTKISNPYLSQVERGLHEPSVRVLKAIATALNVSAETLLRNAGLLEAEPDATDDAPETEAAIRADDRLTADQKQALLAVYRSYVATNT